MESAIAAIDSEDWGAALKHLLKAKGAISILPNGGAGDASLAFDRNAIDSLIDEVKAQQGADSDNTAASADANSSIRYGRFQYTAPQGAVGVED